MTVKRRIDEFGLVMLQQISFVHELEMSEYGLSCRRFLLREQFLGHVEQRLAINSVIYEFTTILKIQYQASGYRVLLAIIII